MTLEYSFDPESVQRALVETRCRSDELGLGVGEERLRYTDQIMRMRRQRIERAVHYLIDSCSAMYESDTGGRTLKPVPTDLEYAVWLLLQTRAEKAGPGRPHSPRVNGPRLRELRREARMTQTVLIEAVDERLGLSTEPHRKTLQRYEQSEPGDPKRLAVIAAILTEHLSRTVTVEDITF
jgi:hypothetical protein